MHARRSPPSAERLVLVGGGAVAVTLAAVSLVLPRVTTLDALTNPLSPWVMLIDVRSEANVHTWFNVALLAAAAAAYVALGYVARSLGRPAWTWLLIACVLAALSLDDMIAVHERLESIGRTLGGGAGGLHFAWVVPGAIVAAAALALVVLAGRRLPPRTRAYLAAGMLLLIVAALGLEVVGGALLDGRGNGPAYILVSHLEELLETFAAVLMLNSAVVALPRAAVGGAGTRDEHAVM